MAQTPLFLNINDSPQGETSLKPNANPTEIIRKNPLQITESSFPEILPGQKQNQPVE